MAMTAKTTRRQHVSYDLHLQRQTAAVVDFKWSPLSIATTHNNCSRLRPFTTAMATTSSKVGSGHFERTWSCVLPAGLKMTYLSLLNQRPALSKHSCRLWQERRYEEHSEWTNFFRCPTYLCHCRWFAGRSAYDVIMTIYGISPQIVTN